MSREYICMAIQTLTDKLTTILRQTSLSANSKGLVLHSPLTTNTNDRMLVLRKTRIKTARMRLQLCNWPLNNKLNEVYLYFNEAKLNNALNNNS